MSEKNKTFQAVAALLSLQEEKEKIYNLGDFTFSDKNRNIPVCPASHHSELERKHDSQQFDRQSKSPLKATVYMELAKSSMVKGKLELRDFKGANLVILNKQSLSILIFIFISNLINVKPLKSIIKLQIRL